MRLLQFFCIFSAFALISGIDRISLLNPDERKLADSAIEFLRPYSPQIRRWLWEISGVSAPSQEEKAQSRADFITCEVCTNALPLLRDLIKVSIPDETIILIISAACVALDLAPRADICEPTIRSYATSVLYIIKTKPDMLDNDFCGVLNPGCVEISDKFSSWKVRVNNVKPAVEPVPEVPDEAGTVKILQFTDIHLDLDYEIGTNSDCGLPICCRKDNGAPENETFSAGMYGHFSCGLPRAGLDALYKNARELHGDAKFIFLTGDYVHSGVWLYSEQENSRHIMEVTSMLKETFKDTAVQIFPLTGNHEPDVVNMYPPVGVWDRFNLNWMYKAVSEQFAEWIPPIELIRFNKYGYYTVTPSKSLRLIVLNTNICYINNFWLPYDPIDTFGQLQWFADTLDLAEKLGENVIVLGHIQPGSGSCWPVWSNQFNRIINRYEAIIRGQFYGHSHEQYYTVAFEDETKRPISVSFVAGSALTDGMNSAYNVYYADGVREDATWEIINQQTYVLNLTESNVQQTPVIPQILDANTQYGVKSMRPEAIFDFINRMVCDDELFQTYQQVSLKGRDSPRLKPCINNSTCKSWILSDMFVSNSADHSYEQEFQTAILNDKCTKDEADGGATTLQISFFTLTVIIFSFLVIHY